MSKKSIYRFAGFVLAVMLLTITLMPIAVRAAGPWYVSTTGSDANDCLSPETTCGTINGAIGKATSGDTINVAIGTYTSTGNEVVLLDKNATLTGGWNASFTTQGGVSTVDGEGARRGMSVNSGVTATVEHFTLQNGNVTGNGGGILNAGTLTFNESNIISNTAGSGIGSGIYNTNTGNLTVNNSTVSLNGSTETCFVIANEGTFIANNTVVEENATSTRYCVATIVISFSGIMTMTNTAIRNNPIGGGLYNYATLALNNSVVSGNIGSDGPGGIYSWGGTLTVNNSTISGNSTGNGGGIFLGGGGIVRLNNDTISNNTASIGGGIYNYPNFPGEVFIQNTIIAGNTATDTGPDCNGSVGSAGNNLIGNNSDCTFTSTTGDLVGTSDIPIDPLLGALQNNGGPTYTHALLPGSPAIDAGNPAGCRDQNGSLLTIDQRGVVRPQGTRCDIGAFELEAVNPVIQVAIDIKPGSAKNPINMKSPGVVPVAILSAPGFDAPAMVDRTSLTFGKTGDEVSLKSCNKLAADVNSDGLLDLICQFRVPLTGFHKGDSSGILKGMTVDDVPFEGSDVVTILK